jgi:nucleotide-binding universal stress UspA family protein
MQSVLVGVDGSDDSRTALRWGAMLASVTRLPLRAMWSWAYPGDAIVSWGRLELPHPRRADALVEGELFDLVKETLGEQSRRVLVEAGRGPAAGALLAAAEDPPALLVVGSRGLGGFKGLLLGSVSRQLCEHAVSPVTVLRGQSPVDELRLRTVMVGVDGSPGADRAQSFAARLATEAGAELVIASAVASGDLAQRPGTPAFVDLEGRRELIEGNCAPLRRAGLEPRVAVAEGDARPVLTDLAREHGADLLVVGSRGLGPVSKLLLGSVASSLLHHAEMPVMVVPHPR